MRLHWIITFTDDAGRGFAWHPVHADDQEAAVAAGIREWPQDAARASDVSAYPHAALTDGRHASDGQPLLAGEEYCAMRREEERLNREAAAAREAERQELHEHRARRDALRAREAAALASEPDGGAGDGEG